MTAEPGSAAFHMEGDIIRMKRHVTLEELPDVMQVEDVMVSSVRLDDGTFFKIIGGDNDA